MTTPAWLMLFLTWSVIIYFTAKLLIKAIKSPKKDF